MRALCTGMLIMTLSACAPNFSLPDGTTCTSAVRPQNTFAGIVDALASATRGTCVVAAAGKYSGALTVPPGVVLGAEVGTTVELTTTDATQPAVTLGAGASLTGFTVLNPPGVGVSAGLGAQLIDLRVSGAKKLGVVFWCEEDCLTAQGQLHDVQLTGNAVGLLVHGARVQVTGGTISGSESLELAGGYGVVASHGAQLGVTGTRVEDNEALGVLVDGAFDTSATLEQVEVLNNRGRGVWAQGLTGTMGSPRLALTGCTVAGNRLAGVGVRGSRGVRMSGGTVRDTVIGQTSTGTGMLVSVGDGVGLFEQTGDVVVDQVALSQNGRSQLLVDTGASGVTVQNSTITSGAGQLGVVVQRTTAMVQAPMIVTPQPGNELAVAAPTLGVPTR